MVGDDTNLFDPPPGASLRVRILALLGREHGWLTPPQRIELTDQIMREVEA